MWDAVRAGMKGPPTCLCQLHCKLSQQCSLPVFRVFTVTQHDADVLHLSFGHVSRRNCKYSVGWLCFAWYLYFTSYMLHCSVWMVVHATWWNGSTKTILYVPLKPDHGALLGKKAGCRSLMIQTCRGSEQPENMLAGLPTSCTSLLESKANV